ncbi:hydantoinase B/oxoprolinase family protein [Helicobacter pylori]|uniref:hydantoinase B/oxoprolinase family protein n=1 Tax=Helicobacter pylori TaxID=210 RepID=UPI0002BC6882|nr:hydantoinase B/oxoprolinase family protein [Helicobacter pylori]MDO7809310.1 hydantoinase B/oxoprolinase family protein [Helicobacter pylori]MDO7815183.1 hydantoinase B/oxoprolinase family protein [Helicobacter pylori]MDO7819750.1 hydantoinase B/oxoprolinase family protein [Helicobacter pylori]MDO7829121.1 hydantoinase B/oxoprolinase family protein [Helicobacter pylori]MDO7866091.1 hydantoinase B/oxoprolinase family protein [Helicobacter pylori]
MANLLKNGKTLKQARDEILARTEKTGHYNGLKKLEFKERDPIGYEKMFSKLRGGIVHARETAKRIAASPIVEQEGELCFTLYNAVGDSVLTSTGIIIHVGTMGSAIKYMVENNWEDNPGINDKDIFTNNDCAIGNVHPCDIMTLVPIFHDEKLIGWVGGVTHVIDTGSVTPGSMSTGQVQRFGDGYMITCRKTGANDESFKDWLHESQRSVRTPKYWILDERTRIAGCHMIRDLVMEVIKEDGIDSYMRFIDEVIEEGRRGLISRIKSMTIPGKYRKVAFVDVPYAHKDIGVCSEFAKLDTIMHSPVEITINKDATWKLDFDGASRWGWHSFNCNQVSFTSGIWVMMTQTLIPTSRINDGAYFATQFRLKKGTWMNPDDRRTGHAYAWHFLVSGWSALWRGLSQAYYSRGYLEEVNSGNANTSNWLQGGGINQDGEIHAVNSFETSSCGTGACAIKDGLNHAAAIWNPEGDMGDVEIWEMAEPLLYLGRNVKANTGGYGKYRGGNGFETLRMVWGAHDWTMFFMGNGYMNSDWGMMGGYPAASGYRFEAHNTDLENRIKNNASLPLGGDFNPTDRDYEKHISHASQVKRDKQCITTENCFDNYDLYLNYIKGGPGFGDPIERDLNAILEDLNSKQLLPEYAYKVYGAIVSQNKDGIWVGDEAKTKARRKEILENRKARSIPVKQWMEQERNAILEKEASKQVKHMYATSFDLSPKFLNDFKTFWNLPKSWSMKEDELGVFTYGSKYRMDLSKLPDVRTVLLVDEK